MCSVSVESLALWHAPLSQSPCYYCHIHKTKQQFNCFFSSILVLIIDHFEDNWSVIMKNMIGSLSDSLFLPELREHVATGVSNINHIIAGASWQGTLTPMEQTLKERCLKLASPCSFPHKKTVESLFKVQPNILCISLNDVCPTYCAQILNHLSFIGSACSLDTSFSIVLYSKRL